MCRNIKTLFNFEPPATELEIRDSRSCRSELDYSSRFARDDPEPAQPAPDA